MSSELISEHDLELIDAIQVNPRASWKDIGVATGVSAMSAARRWTRLREAGLAWSNSTAGPELSQGMVIELACAPGSTDRVVRDLAGRPDVMTVGHLTGEWNIYALTVSSSVKAVANFQLDVVNALPVLRLRTHLYHHAYGGSRRWRLHVLRDAQTSHLLESVKPPIPWRPASDVDRGLFLALAEDARRPLTALAEDLDLTPQAVGRQLVRAQRNGTLDFRADVARPYAGLHLGAFLWIRAAQDQVHTVSEKLGLLPETRFCATISGTVRNILLIVSLHGPEEVDELIRRIEISEPPVRVADCQFALRLEKVDGRLLDENGRAIGFVPVDPWASEMRANR